MILSQYYKVILDRPSNLLQTQETDCPTDVIALRANTNPRDSQGRHVRTYIESQK